MRRVLSEDPSRNVRVVAIDVDGIRRPTPAARAKALREDLEGDLAVASADERTLHLYGQVMGRSQIPGTPTFFVIDRDGFVYAWHGGIARAIDLMAPLEFLYGVDRYRIDREK